MRELLFYNHIKSIITVLIFCATSAPVLATAFSGARTAGHSVRSVLEGAGLSRKIELSSQIKSEIERIMSGAGLGEVGEELLRLGNLQEIIWQLQEMGAEQQSEDLTLLVRDMLENAEIIDMEDIGVGVSGAQLIKFANGLRGVFKTTSSGDDEFIREEMV